MTKDGTTFVLTPNQMRALGFTDHRPDKWYWTRQVIPGVSLNFTIDKATGDYEELVMDEDFGQPYPYGRFGQAEKCQQTIDIYLDLLNAEGLTLAVDPAAYGAVR